MPIRHTVIEGECLDSVAAQYGFFPSTVWDHPDNADLRGRRESGNILAPGDVLVIPDLRLREVHAETGKAHRFRRKGVPSKLQVRLIDDRFEPRAGIAYELVVDGGAPLTGKTDADGWIRCAIPPSAAGAKLILHDGGEPDDLEAYDLEIGALHPLDIDSGVSGRLVNLGVRSDDPDDDEDAEAATKDAIMRFQSSQDIPATGDPDARTLDALRSVSRS